MKKRTLSKLKSIFGSKKEKRQLQQQQTKCSRTTTPEPAPVLTTAHNESFRPLLRTPPPSRVGPPPSPPVPTNPIVPVPPEPSGPLPLSPCPVCTRTFLPQSLAKHIKICEKMTVKKRKTFDSSRQRREGLSSENGVNSGTDLEQYLPKNFGLPETSPFLEKSPPNTAKVTPKPKSQSIRSTVTKQTAELQKCPHCSRAFGVRAFERHVEWCADKAKILPAAPAQPPPHIADAKQRLNARTQYKAPPVRGRRSSQSRDKSSNSRSASVDSSRGVSPPPPPREYGDYNKNPRNRASESVSSNDCHEESPHMPVIRNTRNSLNSSSGDANVKARQARLARDLSSTRHIQESHPSSVQPSNTDPNVNKMVSQDKQCKRSLKKQKQLKKLEALASQYSEKNNKNKEDSIQLDKRGKDKSQIPIPKKRNVKVISHLHKNPDCEKITDETSIDNESKVNTRKKKNISKYTKSSEKDNMPVYKKQSNVCESKGNDANKDTNNSKERSMSFDSLEDNNRNNSHMNKNCQSIGINTEFICPCVPCIIYDNPDQKSSKKLNNVKISKEPAVEVLYKNLTLISSTDIDSKLTESTESCSPKLSEAYFHDNDVAINETLNDLSDREVQIIDNVCNNIDDVNTESRILTETLEKEIHLPINSVNNSDDYLNDNIHNLSAERFEECCEHDTSGDIFHLDGDKPEDENNNKDKQEIMCRHGSGDTYTKFTENPADLEEFMNITDKMMDNSNLELFESLEQDLVDIHTPKTNSLEDINTKCLENNQSKGVFNFSETINLLKTDLKELLDGVSNNNHKNSSEKPTEDNFKFNRKVCDMEHITIYQHKFQKGNTVDKILLKNVPSELKLPSITENNNPASHITSNNKMKLQRLYKPNRKYKMLGEQRRANMEYQTFIVKEDASDSDGRSITSEAPPLKLPRIENKRLDENYDPFVSAARQMKELMSSETNIPKKLQTTSKDPNRTLPMLRPGKEKSLPSYLRTDNTKMMKDTLNKTYQRTPTLQRMKSFGSTNNDNNNTSFGSRCSSFRINRNDKKANQKLNTTFTKSSKENISTTEKAYFNRNNNLNRSFSSYTASNYSTPKPKEKIPKITTSLYHSFQRTTKNQPLKLDKINKDDQKEFVNLDSILIDDNSSMTDSNYIDPRLINENDNLPINVNTILNNPDIICSMESLLTTENLPAKFESFSSNSKSNKCSDNKNNNESEDTNKIENKNNVNNNMSNKNAPIIDDLSAQYDRIMSSLERSIGSKASREASVCEDFDLEDFITSFDEEITKHNQRTCSSTTRIVKHSEIIDSNRSSTKNSVCSTPKTVNGNGFIPVNKSMSLTFSSNNIISENMFPSSVKRSTSLLDSIQKKHVSKSDGTKNRNKVDQLEQDLMQSLKDFDKMYETDKIEVSQSKVIASHNMQMHNGTAKPNSRVKSERKNKHNEIVSNGNYTPSGKASNDSAYSSLNRISPSKLSICNSKEPNILTSLEQIPAGSDSSGKEEIRSVSSEEFLAMERSTELDEPLPKPDITFKELENHPSSEKRVSSRASSRRSPTWRGGVSSSGSETSLHRPRRDSAPRLSRFCHECGSKFPMDTAKFCIECGVKRLLV